MNRMCVIFFLFTTLFSASCAQQLTIQVQAEKYAPLHIMLVYNKQHPEIAECADTLAKALAFTGQFAVKEHIAPMPFSKKDITALWPQGIAWIVFLDAGSNGSVECRLYDTQQVRLLIGKKISRPSPRILAYALADMLWPELTGMPGFFSTKLAYCKQVDKGKKHYKHIYIADYDGSHEQLLVGTPTVNVAPRWNKDVNKPLLFYSESTTTNIRMMAVTMKKERAVVSSFDGLNMQPAFSADGKRVVYCASRGLGECHLYQWAHHELKRITNNNGNNVAPTFTKEGNIYFVCDAQTGQPQICYYDLGSKVITRVTPDGYCASPTYCDRTGLLAYTKIVGGVMQLFVYDDARKEHTQLTTDNAQKEECCWSPCGTYLLCSVDNGKNSRLALFNRFTQEYLYLTDSHDDCSYPTWSGIYQVYPVVG